MHEARVHRSACIEWATRQPVRGALHPDARCPIASVAMSPRAACAWQGRHPPLHPPLPAEDMLPARVRGQARHAQEPTKGNPATWALTTCYCPRRRMRGAQSCGTPPEVRTGSAATTTGAAAPKAFSHTGSWARHVLQARLQPAAGWPATAAAHSGDGEVSEIRIAGYCTTPARAQCSQQGTALRGAQSGDYAGLQIQDRQPYKLSCTAGPQDRNSLALPAAPGTAAAARAARRRRPSGAGAVA